MSDKPSEATMTSTPEQATEAASPVASLCNFPDLLAWKLPVAVPTSPPPIPMPKWPKPIEFTIFCPLD